MFSTQKDFAYPINEHTATTGLSGTLAKNVSQRRSNSGDIVLSSSGVGRILPRASNPLARGIIKNYCLRWREKDLTCVPVNQYHLSTIVLRVLKKFRCCKIKLGAATNLQGPLLEGRRPSIRYRHYRRMARISRYDLNNYEFLIP